MQREDRPPELCTQEPSLEEILELGKAPSLLCPFSGVALLGPGEAVESWTSEPRPLPFSLFLSLSVFLHRCLSFASEEKQALNPQGIKRGILRTRNEISQEPSALWLLTPLELIPPCSPPDPAPRGPYLRLWCGGAHAILHSVFVAERFLNGFPGCDVIFSIIPFLDGRGSPLFLR